MTMHDYHPMYTYMVIGIIIKVCMYAMECSDDDEESEYDSFGNKAAPHAILGTAQPKVS